MENLRSLWRNYSDFHRSKIFGPKLQYRSRIGTCHSRLSMQNGRNECLHPTHPTLLWTIEKLRIRTRTNVQRRHPRLQRRRTYTIGVTSSVSLYQPRRRCRGKILKRLRVPRLDSVSAVEKKMTHPRMSQHESSFRTHRSRYSRAAVPIEAYKFGGLDSKKRKNVFNSKFQIERRRQMEVGRTHPHLRRPSLSRLILRVNG